MEYSPLGRRLGGAAAILTAAIVALLVIAPAPVQAGPTDLTVGLRAGPAGPMVVLTNRGAEPCQVAVTTLGTVTAVRVAQGGRTVEPTTGEVTFIESLDVYLASVLRVLEPGDAVDLPLAIVASESGPALETVAWAGTTRSRAWLHPISLDRPVELEIGYDVPVTPKAGPALCGAGSGSGTISAAPSFNPLAGGRTPVVLIAGLAALAVAALGAILLVLRRARRRRVAARAGIVVVLIGLALVPAVGAARPASADILVDQSDGDLVDMWRQCESIFRAPGGDPAGIFPVLDDPDTEVHIGRTGVGLSQSVHTERDGKVRTDIRWNWIQDRAPTDAFGPGGGREPCPTIYHELYHAARRATEGPVDDSWCYTKESGMSGVPVGEVHAVREAENPIRVRLGLPPRQSYNGFPIPNGECTEPEDPDDRGPVCGNVGCGYTTGDPHLRTFDGRHYAFQAVGEFVLTRDPGRGFEIQTRQAPLPVPRIRTVSINTAVAFDVAGDRVELRHTKGGLTLLVGGASRPLGPAPLPGGGSIGLARSGRGDLVVVTWPDGSVAQARYGARAGITLTVAPAERRRARLVGLLGDYDGDRADDLKGAGDRVIAEPTFDALYPGFADRWRVDAGTSLFTYAAGTSPESYVDRVFPDRPPDPATLPNRASAERLCRSAGVTTPEVLADCLFDVAVTGQPDFAWAAVVSQASLGVASVDGPPVTVTVARPGATARLTFAGQAGQTVAVRVSQSTLPTGCGMLRLLDPAGTELGDGCIVGATGGIGAVQLPAAGQYTVLLDPQGDRAGVAAIAINSVTAGAGTIRAGGPPATVTIGQPGATARLTFAGVTGDVVVVGVNSATWSAQAQCAVPLLLGPDGKRLGSGCVVDGAGGIDPVRLTATGRYSIVVDPRDDITGTARIVLSSVSRDGSPIEPDGPTVTASVGAPGGAAMFTFEGKSGQRIVVEVTASTMPPSCGHIRLLPPEGGAMRLARWCVIGGRGTMSAMLPATGRYTIVFDPTAAGTGTAHVRLTTPA